MKKILAGLMLGCAAAASPAYAQVVSYEFDTLTEIRMHSSAPEVIGVLRNETTPTSVSFIDDTNVSYRYVVNRCLPLFLTMLEKPGRYYLRVWVNTAAANVQLLSCALSLRS